MRYETTGELRTASIGCWMFLFVKMTRLCGEGHAPENLAVLRHLALNVLRQEKSARIGTKANRLKAAWSTEYLWRVVSQNHEM